MLDSPTSWPSQPPGDPWGVGNGRFLGPRFLGFKEVFVFGCAEVALLFCFVLRDFWGFGGFAWLPCLQVGVVSILFLFPKRLSETSRANGNGLNPWYIRVSVPKALKRIGLGGGGT